MKKSLLALICFLSFLAANGQSNEEIAGVYIRRSQESLNNFDIKLSKENFDKAMKYTDSITSSDVARLGMQIYYKLNSYKEAKKYAKYYFEFAKNKKTEEYAKMLDLSVNITEEYEAELLRIKEQAAEERRKQKELTKIDSLKTFWIKKAETLTVKVDSIYEFNKNNIAVYKTNDFYGIINDVGEILLPANEYKDVIYFDGYFIFKNQPEEPTKLFCFNSNEKSSFQLIPLSEFNTLSTNYGKVMLPRANGRLVTYPNNSLQPLVYDLNERKVVKIANEEELFKTLKKADVIDRFNKDGEVRVLKEWYLFGGHLGGGIHPLYTKEGNQILAFLCSVNGKVLKTNSDYQFIGSFYNDNFQAISKNTTYWINANGNKVEDPENENGTYLGNSVITKLENGVYQFSRDGFIILGNEQLEKMPDFLRKFQKSE